jgi:DNA helicase-4
MKPIAARKEWRPSGPGRLLTGSKLWRFTLSGHGFCLERAGESDISGHLVELTHLGLTQGSFWATCRFFFSGGREVLVDGIPNVHAAQMQDLVNRTTATTLASALSSDFLTQFSSWFDARQNEALPAPTEWSDPARVDAALAGGEPVPSLDPDLTIERAVSHRLFNAPSHLDEAMLARLRSPRDFLLALQDRHDHDLFAAKFQEWRDQAQVEATAGNARWWSQSASHRALARWPPPCHPTRGWLVVPAMGAASTPEGVLDVQRETFNAVHSERERQNLGLFFATVEKSPLTAEQIDAVVCFDDHELVIAAAGSGKTSTMVAKAGYALERELCRPDQILLLAFNSDAAKELDERVKARLSGIPGVDQITAKTFHAFGKEVIRLATGEKPMLATWMERSGQDVHQMVDIIESLCVEDSSFASSWETYRLVFAQDIGRWDLPAEPEDWDSATGKRGFRTAQGEVVRSKEERTIADWLFYHGIEYRYEEPYKHPTADLTHRQYIPDFYFPQIDLYYEHFALDANGKAPAHFDPGYEESARWKRDLHARMGTQLIETTSHELRSGLALDKLIQTLTERGVVAQFNSKRIPDQKPQVEGKALAKSFRTFQQHVKSNRLSHADLEQAIGRQTKHGFEARLRLYLTIYRQLSDEWERRLRLGGYIDFDDMLNHAADLLNTAKFESPYLVILADEFQDSSNSRARLLRGLMRSAKGPAHLCVVGDDWQAINRFAGADISIMSHFEQWFPQPERRMLTTTFRCPQDLCKASSEFISANSAQIKKAVQTTNPRNASSLFAFTTKTKDQLSDLVYEKLSELSKRLREPGAWTLSRKPTVVLLNRYRRYGRPYELERWIAEFSPQIDLSFNTIHASKGLEADYVFLLNMVEGTMGFPCKVEDDPALELAMPESDPFPFAEERRLFYVALTRARQEVWAFTTDTTPSQFVVELRRHGRLTFPDNQDGQQVVNPCPLCGKGVLCVRFGRYGAFQGCSSLGCDYTGPLSHDQAKDAICPLCSEGRIVRRNGSRGAFLGCTRYRHGCKWTSDIKAYARQKDRPRAT